MVWAAIVIVVALATFVYFEWRSRNKPLPQGLRDDIGVSNQLRKGPYRGLTAHPDLEKPHD